MAYRFEYDPESGAIYIRVRDGAYHETIPIGEPGLGASVDVDARGNVLGFEFLSFEEYKLMVAEGGGRIEIPDRLQPSYTPPAFDPKNLDAALASLSQRHRAVLEMIYFQDLSNSKVAERLGVSVSTVRRTRVEALRMLRDALEREQEPTIRVNDAELEAFLSTL